MIVHSAVIVVAQTSYFVSSEAMLSLSLYFVVKVSDEKTGKVSAMVNGVQNFGWLSL